MYRPNSLTLCLLSLFVWVCPKNTLQAAAPTLDAFYPPGIQVGKTTEVTTVGKTAPWPSQVSCSNPKITFKPDPKKKGIYSVTASKDAQAGPCLVRLHNQDGASKAMIFMLGKLPEILETVDKKGNEYNDSNARAQKITSLPATINGRLIKSGDIDFYRVSLKKGQNLIARLDSYSMRILMDPYLHLYDSNGSLLVLGNDNGFNLDPFIAYQIKRDGDYTIAVMAYAHPPGASVNFTGRKSAVYRLSLTTGPWLTHALPLAVKNSGNTPLKLYGYNLPSGKKHIDLNFTHPKSAAKKSIISHPSFPNTISLPATSTAPSLLAKNSEIKIPVAATGLLSKDKKTATYSFSAKKGQSLDIRVASQSLGLPLDPVLIIQDAKGKQLKRVDDTAVKTDRDCKLIWSAPADGKYQLLISDLFLKAGPRYHFLLTIKPTQPSFSATFDKTSYFLEAGKEIDVKIKIIRIDGHKTPLKIEASKLPAGISIVPPKDIPNKNADISVKIKAAATAPSANQSIRFTLKESVGDSPISQKVQFSFLPKIPGGPYLLNQLDHTWLTIKGKEKPKTKPSPKAKAKAPAKPKAKPAPKVKSPAKPTAKPAPKAKAPVKPKAKAKTPPNPKASTKANPAAKAKAKPAAKPKSETSPKNKVSAKPAPSS